MSKIPPPLTDQEIYERLYDFVQSDKRQHEPQCGVTKTGDYGNCDCNKHLLRKTLVEFVKDQKHSHGAFLIGEVEPHSEQCHQYKISHQNSSICICNARVRNNLRLEQREVNKGVLNV